MGLTHSAVDASGRSIRMGVNQDSEWYPIYPDWIADGLPALEGDFLSPYYSHRSRRVRVNTVSGPSTAFLLADKEDNKWWVESDTGRRMELDEVIGWLPIDAKLSGEQK